MNVLFAASELSPYAKTGGLGDVLAALPPVLRGRGHSVSCVLPLFRGIREKLPEARPTGLRLTLPLGAETIECRVWRATANTGVTLFLLEQNSFFDRPSLYGEGGDYWDNASRFIFFSKAVVALARHLDPLPQILHLNDWQTGLVPAFVRAEGLPFKTVYTIHNLAYQGSFWGFDFALTNLPGEYFSPRGVEFYGRLNCMKAGIVLADQVTTVSARYAQEIQTEFYGCGLDRVLGEHRAKLTGILNGVDYALWNPKDDAQLPAPYHAGNLKGKAACKDALLAEFGLAPDPAGKVPVYGCITRLTPQKGIDLLQAVLPDLLADDVRFVFLGSGDRDAEEWFRAFAARHPGKVGARIGFDEKLSHRVVAGSDFFLMPSLFEPCGLTQMYSLRYGTLPIVHETGGLADSVEDYRSGLGEGTGFVFRPYAAAPFREACRRAASLFRQKAELLAVRRRAMKREFSWERSAAAYEEVYLRALPS